MQLFALLLGKIDGILHQIKPFRNLLLVRVNLHNPLVVGIAPTHAFDARGVVGLQLAVVRVGDVVSSAKVLNPVV